MADLSDFPICYFLSNLYRLLDVVQFKGFYCMYLIT